MAVRGRKSKPAAVKAATGNPGKRPITEGPDFSDGSSLAPPKRWRKKGQELVEWNRIVPDLQRVKVAKAVHQGMLEAICEMYATWLALAKAKEHAVALRYREAYRKALNEFGLTAASAGRVGGQGGGISDDPDDQFFTKPRLVR